MDFLRVTKDNLAKEHICCAIANEKDVQVSSKKAWLKDRFDEGLVFLKADVRGKCFIEYLPAEFAWVPIEAPGFMYIDCLWVSGQFKGQGYSNELLQQCIDDSRAQGKKGLVTMSSKKKMGFLADKKYLSYKGFQTVDEAEPYFELMYLPFEEAAKGGEMPHFRKTTREKQDSGKGFSIYYTNQCPFTAKYVPILSGIAQSQGVDMEVHHLQTREEAQDSPCPFTTFSLFYKGRFLTHEIQSEKKFLELIHSVQEG